MKQNAPTEVSFAVGHRARVQEARRASLGTTLNEDQYHSDETAGESCAGYAASVSSPEGQENGGHLQQRARTRSGSKQFLLMALE